MFKRSLWLIFSGPPSMRNIRVDLSEERMARAWEAYKLRWAMEENTRREMEERKLVNIFVL